MVHTLTESAEFDSNLMKLTMLDFDNYALINTIIHLQFSLLAKHKFKVFQIFRNSTTNGTSASAFCAIRYVSMAVLPYFVN